MRKPPVEVGRWDERGTAGRAGPQSSRPDLQSLQALEALAWMLDSSIQIPGTRIRIGLDAIVGLIPGIGDLIGAALSAYIMAMAARLGVPRVTLLRMGLNITVDAMVGMVPFLGDVFDAAWKANRRNVELLRAHLENPGDARRVDWLFAAGLSVVVLVMVAALGWAGFTLLRWIASGLGT